MLYFLCGITSLPEISITLWCHHLIAILQASSQLGQRELGTGDLTILMIYVCVCFKRHMTPLLRISWTVLLQFSSIAQFCPTLCDPMDCSMPGFPVHHPLLELTQNSCSLNQWCHPTISSCVIPSPPAFSLS